MYTIRNFQPEDMFSVIKIASDTLTEQYSPSLFNYLYETYSKGFFVAEIAHKVVGFIVGIKLNDTTAKVLMLSVVEKHRRKKVATALLNQFIESIKKEKVKIVELEVRTDNKGAIAFYQKQGFKIVDRIDDFYQDGKSAYIMRKMI